MDKKNQPVIAGIVVINLIKESAHLKQMEKTHQIIVIVGPTAIGKTKLSIDLAQHWGCNIISADSRQFYKEMAIGTAVPSAEELSAAPHHLIQHKSIHNNYTVGDFEREALDLIEEFSKTHSKTIVVGGSGLYVNALLYGLDEFPQVPEHIRSEINLEFDKNGIGWLQEALKKVDPVYYNQVDNMNPQRMIRALEVYRASGIAFSTLRMSKPKHRPFNYSIIGLTAPRPKIYERINLRVEQMMADGLVEEARTLYVFRALNALQTVGYKELFEYFDNKISLEQATEMIKQNTRRFSKRQMTWFKKNQETHWFTLEHSAQEIINHIQTNAAT
jgi:tRNA dimethylallyltransferase